VYDQKYCSKSYGTERDPSLLLIVSKIGLRDGVWIVKNKLSGLETEFVLPQIPLVLSLIPFE